MRAGGGLKGGTLSPSLWPPPAATAYMLFGVTVPAKEGTMPMIMNGGNRTRVLFRPKIPAGAVR